MSLKFNRKRKFNNVRILMSIFMVLSLTVSSLGYSLFVPTFAYAASIAISETGGETRVSEAGTSDTFTVRLDSQPTAAVTVDVSSSDASEATASPSMLTFTPVNWNVAQTVTVTGVDDFAVDGNQTSTIDLESSSVDANFDALTASVTVITTDNETSSSAGITITESDGNTTVSETGSSDFFDIRLNSQPSSDVVVDITSSDTGEATVSPSSVTFTTANWNAPQTVTVTGVDDSTADGNETTAITLTSTSSDENYNGRVASITATTVDNETVGITVSETDGNTTVSETETTDTFGFALNSQPSANVVLSVTSNDTSEVTVSPATLTFTQGNWNDPQTVTVTGVDDAADDGNQTVTVVVSVADGASASEYTNVPDRNVAVTNIDDDPTTQPGPGPVLLTPPDGTKLIGMGTTLTWVNPTGTTQYQIQVRPFNDDGPGINLIRNVESSYTVEPPDFGSSDPDYVMLPDITYTWRVRTTTSTAPSESLSEADWTEWSSRTFETGNVSSSTTDLESPTGGMPVTSLRPTLIWSNSNEEVFYYEVQVSKDSGFSDLTGAPFLYWELRHGGETNPPNSYTIPSAFPLEPNTTYFWRVRPRIQGDGTPVAWTDAAQFRTP